MFTLRTSITACLALAMLLALGCTAPEEETVAPQDLGAFGGGKADFVGIGFDLPCLAKRGESPDTMSFKLRGSGPFKVSVTQPGTPSRQRAVARIQLDDGLTVETTPSSNAPSMERLPKDDDDIAYTLTIINRSHTKTLCAHLEVEALEAIAPPTARQTFARTFKPEGGPVTVAFFDADSTLRVTKSGRITPRDGDDVMLLPGVATQVKAAIERGEVVVVVSNQGGVSKGFTTAEIAEAGLATAVRLLSELRAQVHYFDFAPDFDENRKPGPGMALTFEEKLFEQFGVEIDWDSSYMVGDAGWKRGEDIEPDGQMGEDFSNSDRGFAEGLGIEYFHPRDFMGWADFGVRNFHHHRAVTEFNEDNPDFGD